MYGLDWFNEQLIAVNREGALVGDRLYAGEDRTEQLADETQFRF